MELNIYQVKEIVQRALAEDIGLGDLTTDSIFSPDIQGRGYFLAKEKGIIAGLTVAQLAFNNLDPQLKWESLKKDGEVIQPGVRLASFSGSLRAILTAERTALNFLQRLSAIATKTANYVAMVSGYPVQIVDTRKTTPGIRILEKYAVRIGGGRNHRLGLFDAVMIKDNHIKAAGNITKAVEITRNKIPITTKIEVETETLEQVQEAIDNKVDIIMLDNMTPELMYKAIQLINKRALVEASGGITQGTILEVAATGVDIISIGELTHTIKALDISLELQ